LTEVPPGDIVAARFAGDNSFQRAKVQQARKKYDVMKAVLGILMCLSLPDPLVRGMDPDPDPSFSS
jgi:hypothetical protein